MDERKRDSMIAYLRHRMEEFGIKPEDLAAVLASEPVAEKNARYRSATRRQLGRPGRNASMVEAGH